MGNPEKLAKPGMQDTERRQAKHKSTTQKTKKMSNTKKPGQLSVYNAYCIVKQQYKCIQYCTVISIYMYTVL
jgi:hypothetical protein